MHIFKRSYFFILIIGCSILCHIGCNNSNPSLKIITQWQNKEIQIPEILSWKTFGKDTIKPNDILISPFKILIYIDSIGCSPCKLQLSEWKILMNECKQNSIGISFLFVIHSSDYHQLETEFYFEEFSYPVIYDYNNEFNSLNRFPEDFLFHTFLLDDKNKVLLVGSPINNVEMWKLYKTTLLN